MCSGDHVPWGVGEGTHDHALGVSEGHTCGVVCGGQCEAVALEGEVPVGCGDGGAGVGGHVVDDEFDHGAHAESVGDEGVMPWAISGAAVTGPTVATVVTVRSWWRMWEVQDCSAT